MPATSRLCSGVLEAYVQATLTVSNGLAAEGSIFIYVLYGKLVIFGNLSVVTTEHRHIRRVFQPTLERMLTVLSSINRLFHLELVPLDLIRLYAY